MGLMLPDEWSLEARLVTIDPGTNSLGLAVFYYDSTTYEIRKIEARMYKSEKLLHPDPATIQSHNLLTGKIFAQQENLVKQLRRIKPIAVGVETPYFNPLMPAAGGALNQLFFGIREAVNEYDPMVCMFSVEPSLVKKGVGALSGRGKDAVRNAVLINVDIVKCFQGSLERLDEHSIDAIAIGYTLLTKWRKEKYVPL